MKKHTPVSLNLSWNNDHDEKVHTPMDFFTLGKNNDYHKSIIQNFKQYVL